MRDKNGKNAMHAAAEHGHLSTLKLLGQHFAVWTDLDYFGRNVLHWAALGGHKECALWLIRKARDSSHFLSLTLTDKSPSRCAFEAGHSTLAARLQSWEEGNEEYSNHDDASSGSADSIPKQSSTSTTGPSSTMEESTTEMSNTGSTRARDINTVHNWLKSLKMDEYTENFERDGFDTLRGVATIDEEDLIDMRVKKGHRRVVLSHIEELRNQLAILDENSQKTGVEPDSSPTLGMLPQSRKTPFEPPSGVTVTSAPSSGSSNESYGSNNSSIHAPPLSAPAILTTSVSQPTIVQRPSQQRPESKQEE
jgi:hypothetical protein